MPSPILARADALMQRRVSGHAPEHDAAEDFPILTDALDEEEEIPILLQVEAAPETAPAPPAGTAGKAGRTADLTADLARALEIHLQAHLQAALPGLIEQAVAEVMARRHPPEPAADTPEAAQ
ncbi:MAG: hypothetical protein ACK5JI_02020 [Azonexus sp.]